MTAQTGSAQGSATVSVWIVDPISHSGMAYYDASLADALASAGISVTIVGSDRWLLPGVASITLLPLFRGTHGSGSRFSRALRYVAAVVRLVVLAKRERVPIVHWQYVEIAAVDFGAFVMLRAMGVRVVQTLHETAPWGAGPAGRLLARLLAQTASAVIVHHDQDLVATDRMGIRRSRTRVIQHGGYALFARPDLPQADARSQLGLADSPVALFFGSMRPSKGLDDLLQAWVEVRGANPAARLAIVGPPYRGHGSDLEGRVRCMGLAGVAILRLGAVDPHETNLWYRAADLVALPYREITTSGVLRYAYSSGRAVVATAVGEHQDLVVPGNTGTSVPARPPDILAAALVERLADPCGTAEMGRMALDLAGRQLDWQAIGYRTADLYRPYSNDHVADR